MDKRYFHGVRTAAAMALSSCATSELDWVGLYHLEKAYHDFFCFPGSSMTRSNDFSDRTSYIIQCIIPKAMTSIRDHNGRVPSQVKTFLLATLKFNDNSSNSVRLGRIAIRLLVLG